MILLTLAFIGDFLWMAYWIPHWWSAEMAKWQLGLHNFVILCSFGNFVLKLIILPTLASISQAELKNAGFSLPRGGQGA